MLITFLLKKAAIFVCMRYRSLWQSFSFFGWNLIGILTLRLKNISVSCWTGWKKAFLLAKEVNFVGNLLSWTSKCSKWIAWFFCYHFLYGHSQKCCMYCCHFQVLLLLKTLSSMFTPGKSKSDLEKVIGISFRAILGCYL